VAKEMSLIIQLLSKTSSSTMGFGIGFAQSAPTSALGE
jgi:hypothetical protein